MKNPAVLPEAWLRCIDPAERAKLGPAGRTALETQARAEAKTEKELQKQILGLLRLKGIEANMSRMDKRKTDRVGWPDITFAVLGHWMGEPTKWYRPTWACAWEIKLHGELSVEQQKMAVRLQSPPNCWRWRVIRSVDEAIAELKDMGL